MALDRTPSDAAFATFKALLASDLAAFVANDHSESDTRAKLIDPIFKAALGWHEADIRREEPIEAGYVDYVIGADYPWFHTEAKRIQPRFKIQAPSRSRILNLSGPHLLGQKEMKPFLEQAARYAPELGSDFAVLTNGEQFVIFRTRPPGRKWRDGIALVWHDHKDILDNFAEFYNLLSRERVRSGSLLEAFETAENVTLSLHSPIESIWNADIELVRNRFWNQLSRWLGPLLTDQPESEQVQTEIIEHCYVRTRLSDQTDETLDRLLADAPQPFLKNAGTIDLAPGMGGKSAFEHQIEADVKLSTPGTYVLTGGVGSGKTTFLKRFASVSARSLVTQYCVWLHIDFLPAGKVDTERTEEQLKHFAFARMRQILESNYRDECPRDGAALRDLFKEQLDAEKLTRLFGIIEGTPEHNAQTNSVVHGLYRDDVTYVHALFKRHRWRGRRIVVVFDNTDQLGEAFQESVFLLSQLISRECSALAIVALREEKFFAAYRRGIFDAYGDRRFHIGSPHLEHVIQKRLIYGLRKFEQLQREARGGTLNEEDLQILAVIRVLIGSTTKKNQNIIRMLACVSNGDMRYALGMFRDFVSSGNTDMDKILEIVNREGGYTVPFHEFAKSAILGLRRFYRGSVSHIVNVFQRSSSRASSHLTACRILARLASAERSPSRHGEGFVDTTQVLAEYRQSFGVSDDLLLRGEELLRRGLIESEPPRAESIERTDALRITASGAYYWRYLVRSFAYLDLVYVDTPIIDKERAKLLAQMATMYDFAIRFERVRVFLDYLAEQERAELTESGRRGGPYQSKLVDEIRQQVEKELEFIKSRTGAVDLR